MPPGPPLDHDTVIRVPPTVPHIHIKVLVLITPHDGRSEDKEGTKMLPDKGDCRILTEQRRYGGGCTPATNREAG